MPRWHLPFLFLVSSNTPCRRLFSHQLTTSLLTCSSFILFGVGNKEEIPRGIHAREALAGRRAVPGSVAQGRQLLRGHRQRDHHRRRRPGQVPPQRPIGRHVARPPQNLQARNQVHGTALLERHQTKDIHLNICTFLLERRHRLSFFALLLTLGHVWFAVEQRRARPARNSKNARGSTPRGGSRRSSSASRTSKRRARRGRTSGRTSVTREAIFIQYSIGWF